MLLKPLASASKKWGIRDGGRQSKEEIIYTKDKILLKRTLKRPGLFNYSALSPYQRFFQVSGSGFRPQKFLIHNFFEEASAMQFDLQL